MTKEQSEKEIFLKTVANLKEVLDMEKNAVNRDSAIKRFELCFDAGWKTLKLELESKKGILCNSPNDCLKQAYIQGYVAYNDLWMKVIKERNSSVHTYDEKFADALYKRLPEYLKLFQELKEKII
jgi:nucleotidyltransferase substrate binding protein (TIGR01987 family)